MASFDRDNDDIDIDIDIGIDEKEKSIESMTLEELKEFTSIVVKSYRREKARREALDEECDLLAFHVDKLQDELVEIKETHVPKRAPKGSTSSMPGDSALASVICAEGDGNYPRAIVNRIEGACSDKNVICVNVVNFPHKAKGSGELCNYIIICGGADSYVTGYSCNIDGNGQIVDSSSAGSSNDSSSSNVLFRVSMPSAVLSLDTAGTQVAASSMDGSHMVLDLSKGLDDESFIVCREKNHSKYVVRIRWSDDGNLLCTVSHDKSVNLYKRKVNLDTSSISFEKVVFLNFQTTPEDAIFVPSTNPTESNKSDSIELVIALRDSHSLVYISCDENLEKPGTYGLSQRAISMNERDWDAHVSFNALSLNLSVDKKYLLMSNDKHMHILYILGTNTRVRVFNDHDSGDYGKPRVAFDSNGVYLYSNSENSKDIYVYSISTGKLVHKLEGHGAQVKDLAFTSDSSGRALVSCGFDKTVAIWK